MADIEQKYDLDHNDGTTSPTKLDYSHGVSHRILHKYLRPVANVRMSLSLR